MPKFFLKYAWQQSKGWTFFFILFILAQLFFSYKGVETFPFLNYGMYSQPIAKLETVKSYQLQVNNKVFKKDVCRCISSNFLSYQLQYYAQWQQQEFIDPIITSINHRFSSYLTDRQISYSIKHLSNSKEKKQAFARWLKDYLSCCVEEQIEEIDLEIRLHKTNAAYPIIKKDVYRIYPTN